MPRKGLNLLLIEFLYAPPRSGWQAEVLLHLVVMVVRLQYRFFMERPEVPKADSLICRGTSNDLRAPI